MFAGMDIHIRWRVLQTANSGEILDFTTSLVRFYWKQLELAELPPEEERKKIMDDFYTEAMSADYQYLKNTCAALVREQTGIELNPYVDPA